VGKNEDKVKTAREKITRAKSEAAEARKNGKLSEEAYAQRLEKIKRAEELAADLENRIKKGKKKLK